MQNNRLWILMSRRLSGEATPAEQEELNILLENAPDKQYLLEILHSYFAGQWEETKEEELPAADWEARFSRIVGEPEAAADRAESMSGLSALPEFAPARVIPLRRWRGKLAWAAVLLGILLTGALLYFRSGTPLPAAQQVAKGSGGEVYSRPGARTRMLLPDGTQVWLNSNSRLKYADHFNSQSREVELEGEAYFDVAKNASLPFIVHSASINVRVLGTCFTVKSYPQDETIEATLLKGAIEIYRQDNPNAPRILLKPNEKLVFSKHLSHLPAAAGTPQGKLVIHAPDIAVTPLPLNIPDSNKTETSWMYNRLVFMGDNFRELADKMERWYNVKIIFRDEDLYKYRFRGVFENERVEDALTALQLTAPFQFKVTGNEVEIYRK